MDQFTRSQWEEWMVLWGDLVVWHLVVMTDGRWVEVSGRCGDVHEVWWSCGQVGGRLLMSVLGGQGGHRTGFVRHCGQVIHWIRLVEFLDWWWSLLIESEKSWGVRGWVWLVLWTATTATLWCLSLKKSGDIGLFEDFSGFMIIFDDRLNHNLLVCG